MGCRDTLQKIAPLMRWLSIVCGVLLSLGGVLTMLSIDPLEWIQGAYSIVFGIFIVGAEFNIERIIKYMAFLRGFLGKGAFFIYLGLPLVQAGG
jgi:hypothetical protein